VQGVLTVPSRPLDRTAATARRAGAVVRRSEWVIAAFLCWAAAVAATKANLPVRNLIAALNASILLGYTVLIRLDSAGRSRWFGIARDWLPFAILLLAYREMGWLAAPHGAHALESHWVVLDRAVLRGGAKAAIELFGPALPSVLEIAYALVYALGPFSVAMLYINGRRNHVDEFLYLFAAGVLLCYAQFPFWPSEPPRIVFAAEDLPAYVTVFRRLNLWMLGNYGIHTSVFPSAHVSAALSAAFGMRRVMPERKWLVRFLFVMAALITVATVYGRYHYIADAAAGLVMASLALAIAGVTLPSSQKSRNRSGGLLGILALSVPAGDAGVRAAVERAPTRRR